MAAKLACSWKKIIDKKRKNKSFYQISQRGRTDRG